MRQDLTSQNGLSVTIYWHGGKTLGREIMFIIANEIVQKKIGVSTYSTSRTCPCTIMPPRCRRKGGPTSGRERIAEKSDTKTKMNRLISVQEYKTDEKNNNGKRCGPLTFPFQWYRSLHLYFRPD